MEKNQSILPTKVRIVCSGRYLIFRKNRNFEGVPMEIFNSNKSDDISLSGQTSNGDTAQDQFESCCISEQIQSEIEINSAQLIEEKNKKIMTPTPQILQFFESIFKYGGVSTSQLQNFERNQEEYKNLLEMVTMDDGINFYFHTKASIEFYAKWTMAGVRQLQKQAVFSRQIGTKLAEVCREIQLLQVFEDACRKKKNHEMYDWFSSSNPRRKRNLQISLKTEKNISKLSSDLLVIFQIEEKKTGLLIHFLPSYPTLTLGERQEKYQQLTNFYCEWILEHERVIQWCNEEKIGEEISNLNVILLFPPDNSIVQKELARQIDRKYSKAEVRPFDVEQIKKCPFCWRP